MAEGDGSRIVERSEFEAIVATARTKTHPAHWPDGVNIISLDGLSLLGIDRRGDLYLDGAKLHTERRLATQERVIAWIVALASVIGAGSAAVSAFTDLAR